MFCKFLDILLVASTAFAFDVTVFKEVDHKGSREQLSGSSCKNLHRLAGKVRSVNTGGGCARFYEKSGCDGTFIEVDARSPSHHHMGHWRYADKIRSVGPCRDKCSHEVTGHIPEKPFVAELYTGVNYNGESATVTVAGCTKIPLAHVLSVQAYGHCVQLYNNTNCVHQGQGHDSIELRPELPQHKNMQFWGYWNQQPRFQSISHCRHKCIEEALPPPSKLTMRTSTPTSGRGGKPFKSRFGVGTVSLFDRTIGNNNDQRDNDRFSYSVSK